MEWIDTHTFCGLWHWPFAAWVSEFVLLSFAKNESCSKLYQLPRNHIHFLGVYTYVCRQTDGQTVQSDIASHSSSTVQRVDQGWGKSLEQPCSNIADRWSTEVFALAVTFSGSAEVGACHIRPLTPAYLNSFKSSLYSMESPKILSLVAVIILDSFLKSHANWSRHRHSQEKPNWHMLQKSKVGKRRNKNNNSEKREKFMQCKRTWHVACWNHPQQLETIVFLWILAEENCCVYLEGTHKKYPIGWV